MIKKKLFQLLLLTVSLEVLGAVYMFPGRHVLTLAILTVGSWLLLPQYAVTISALLLGSVLVCGYVSLSAVITILTSHTVVLLFVGCLFSQIIVHNDIHHIVCSYVLNKFRPQSNVGLVMIVLMIAVFLSMWISNTSAAAMLMPMIIVLAEDLDIPAHNLLLAVAYGVTIGGMLTPIGTPANLVAIEYASRHFAIHLGFADWFMWVLPFAVVMLLMFGVYVRCCGRDSLVVSAQDLTASSSQKSTMFILGGCILLWATQSLPAIGWSYWLGLSIPEEIIGMGALLLCATVRTDSGRAFSMPVVRSLPISSICMVIAGLMLAEALENMSVVSSLFEMFLGQVALAEHEVFFWFGLLVSMSTEFCSNTAITSLSLPLSPIMMKISNIDALQSIFLLTLSANSAFMLPTATAPNALVLGTGKVSYLRMAIVGFGMSLVSMLGLVLLYTN